MLLANYMGYPLKAPLIAFQAESTTSTEKYARWSSESAVVVIVVVVVLLLQLGTLPGSLDYRTNGFLTV